MTNNTATLTRPPVRPTLYTKVTTMPKATKTPAATPAISFAIVPHVRPTTVAQAMQQIATLRAQSNAIRALRQVAPLTPVQFACLKHKAHYYRRLAMRIKQAPAGTNPFAPKGTTVAPTVAPTVAAKQPKGKGKKVA